MVVGALLGGVALGLLLFAASEIVEHLVREDVSLWFAVFVIIPLVAGDLWAIVLNRLYPWGFRRQTSQMTMFRRRRAWLIGLGWGFDAGTGLTTYRVTSGVWVVSTLAVAGLLPAWVAVVYSAAFGLSLAAVVLWPVRGTGDQPSSEVALGRVRRLAGHRRLVQGIYALFVPFTVAVVLFL